MRILGLAAVGLGSLLACYGAYVAAGPTDPASDELLPGVDYERFVHEGAVAHLVTIDLTNRCVVPAASKVGADGTAEALKTITWAERESMSVAINGSFFYPYEQAKFWDVTPEEGEVVNVLGPTASGEPGPDGSLTAGPISVSPTEWDGQTLSINIDGSASIGASVTEDTAVPGDTAVAITGRDRLIEDGRIVAPASDPHPRTVVGVDKAGATMWWLVIDGKQPGYSDGLSLPDAAAMLLERGAYDALELDGGGSSILVARTESTIDAPVERLSRPMQIRIPGRSRAVANHLGLRIPTAPDC